MYKYEQGNPQKISNRVMSDQPNHLYVDRLREILRNNRKNINYYPVSNTYDNDTRNSGVGDRFGTDRGEVVYLVRNDDRERDEQDQEGYYQQEQLHLPKIRKHKATKPIKYSQIDPYDKMIIKNYMNAKLIEFKQPSYRKPVKKKRSHTLDNIGELPDNSRLHSQKYILAKPVKLIRGNPEYSRYDTNNQLILISSPIDAVRRSSDYPYQPQIMKIKNRNLSSSAVRDLDRNDTSQNIVKQFSDSSYIKDPQTPKKRQKDTVPRKPKLQSPEQIKDQDEEEDEIIDPVNLETYPNILKKTQTKPKTKPPQTEPIPQLFPKPHPVPSRIQKMPTRKQMENFIKNYIPQSQQIIIQDLIKAQSFRVIQDQINGVQSFYFGETRHDKKQGKGVLITHSWYFQGIWDNDQKVRGLQVTEQGKYKGEFRDGVRAGKGEFFWNHGEYYSGDWRNGKKNGNGYWKAINGQSYMGDWKNGQVSGRGVHFIKQAHKYEGQFVNFLKHGTGKQMFPNGDWYEGNFVQGSIQGKGKYCWKNGIVYEGDFIEGCRHGKGIITTPNNIRFEGTFKDDKVWGVGRLQSENGDVFNGMFEANIKNGHGVLNLKKEKRIIKGLWKNNQLIKEDP